MADNNVTTKLILQGDSSGMLSAMGKAQKAVGDFQSAFGMLGGAITKTVGLLAGLAGAGSLVALVKGSIDAADTMSKMSQKVGVAIDQLSGMAYAAELADVSVEELGKGMGKLNKLMYEAAGDPNSGAAKTFENIGVSVTDAAGKLRKSDDVMIDIAERFAGMNDGAAKTALAMEVFGKAGANLIPLLNSGKQGIKEATDEARRFGLVLSEEAGRQAEEFNDNLTRLKSRASGVAMTITDDLLPEINALVDKFAKGGDISDSPFMAGLHSIKAEFMRTAMLVDKLGASTTAFGMMLYGPGSMAGYKPSVERFENMAKLHMMFEDRYADTEKQMQAMANLEVGLDADGNPIKAKGKSDKGKGGDTGKPKTENKEQDWNSAHSKYLDYLSAFEELRSAKVKAANDLETENNRESYETGLTDFRTYLETKQALAEESLYAELVAKKSILSAAETAVVELKPVKDSKGVGDPAKDALNYHAAILKVEQAQKAVTEAESKLNLERAKGREETGKLSAETLRGYQAAGIAALESLGKTVEAERARQAMESESEARRKLAANARAGDALAQQALDNIAITNRERLDDVIRSGIQTSLAHAQNAVEQKLQLAELNGEYQEQYNLLIQLNRIREKQALNAKDITPEESEAITARAKNERLRLELMKTPLGAMKAGFQDIYIEYSNTSKQMYNLARQTAESMQGAFSSFFFDAMQGKLKSLGDYVRNFVASIQQAIANAMAQKVVTGMLSYIAQKDGGAWEGGVQKFATGGVVLSSTTFRTASGLGVMGEAGPEGILPLARTAGGQLGVKSVPGGGSAPNVAVNIINQTGQPMTARQSGSPRFDAGQWVIDVVADNINNHGVLGQMLVR